MFADRGARGWSWLAAALAAWLAYAPVSAPLEGAQAPATFRSVTDAIWVTATAVDKDGRLVTDLTKDDFEVRDNGEVRPITVFRNDPLPFALSLMIDISGSMVSNLTVVRRAVGEMVAQFRPGDRLIVGTFRGMVSLSTRFTARPATIVHQVNATVGGLGRPCVLQLTRNLEAGRMPAWAGTAVWDAIYCGIDAVRADAETPRRIVMVITDGMDNASDARPADVRQFASEYGIMVYAVPMAGSQGVDRESLRALAEESGGGYFYLTDRDDIVETFGRIGEELRHQYLFGFAPAASGDGQHKLVVKVSRPGVTARARRTYVEAVPTGPLRASPGSAPPVPTSNAPGPVSSATGAPATLLDRYERRQFTPVELPNARSIDLWNAFREMQYAAPGWIRARGPVEESRRRLVVATYALELVVAYSTVARAATTTVNALTVVPESDGGDVTVRTADIVEWACRLIQDGPVSPLEREWFMASVAALQHLDGGVSLSTHLKHAEARVPGEPRWVLAKAIALEQQVWPMRSQPGSLRNVSDRNAAEVATMLKAASALPAVHDEAELRWGYFELGRGRVDEALNHFARVGSPQDRDVRYWLHLFRGRALDEARRPAEAVAAYELAVAEIPYAQSAAFALASALVVHRRAGEAAALVTRTLAIRPPRDPWMVYQFPDIRFWDALLATLRGAFTRP